MKNKIIRLNANFSVIMLIWNSSILKDAINFQETFRYFGYLFPSPPRKCTAFLLSVNHGGKCHFFSDFLKNIKDI